MKLTNLVLLLLVFPFIAMGGVNLKNGNFYVSYTDIIVPGGGSDLEVVRTYNSKSTDMGWFGFGWGSDFETYLVVSADGSVVVHENGAGALTRFVPKQAVDPLAAAKKIVGVMRKRTALSEKVAGDLIQKLKNNAELRQAYALKFGVSAELADGTMLFSNTRGLQKVKKVKTGFHRMYNDGKVEHFNKYGRLGKIVDKNKYTIKLNYDKTGNLVSIKDSQAKQLFFGWYTDGKVKSIWSAGDKKASYKYDGNVMSESTDVSGNHYKYSFDTNYNLLEIGYDDKSKTKITYSKKTQFVSEVIDRSGSSTKYDYKSNPKNSNDHYWTLVTKGGIDGKPVTNRYEYEIKTKPDGSRYTYRTLTKINNSTTETIYSECCSLPLKIARGKDITTFEYNDKGLLVKKSSTKGDFIQIAYHKKFNKISKVVNSDGTTNFDYDKKGNLKLAKNSAGKAVLLIYDRKGRITKMIDQDKKKKKKRTLSFVYNALGKPIEIKMEKVGTILVAYDNYGEIKKVESKAGHKMALQVTQAFQSLLAIVKPAGVNLNL